MTDDTAATPPPTDPTPAPEPEPQERPLSRQERRAKWWAETKLDLKWATALLFVLVLSMSGFFWNAWRQPMVGEENLPNITDAFFSQGSYVNGSAMPGRAGDTFVQPGLLVPFEVLSVLLLAALIAGVVIAMRDHKGGV